MPVRIRCTACGHEMLVPGLRSGTNMNCPQCNALFTIPIVLDVTRPAVDLDVTCAHCQHKNAPGTTICRQCGADLVTGKRAPLGRRISLWVERRWPFATAGAVILLAAVFVLVRLLGNLPPKNETASEDPNLSQPAVVANSTLAAELYTTEDPNAQAAVFEQILSQGEFLDTTTALVNELNTYVSSGARTVHGDNAAYMTISLCTSLYDPLSSMMYVATDQAIAVLTQISSQDELGKMALLARGTFGDPSAAQDLSAWWIDLLERELFLDALVADEKDAPADLEMALAETRDQRRQLTQALRRLVQDDVLSVLAPIAERYWRSWRWLGQTRGEAFADALFELAMPYRGRLSVLAANEEEAKEEIRTARRTLSTLGENGKPLAAAAAGIALVRNAPQYASARDRIVTALLQQMSDLKARDQQRIIWALARLTGRLFGSYSSDEPPWEVTPQVGIEVVTWAKQEHELAVTLADDSPWMRPVMLEYKIAVVTADPNDTNLTE